MCSRSSEWLVSSWSPATWDKVCSAQLTWSWSLESCLLSTGSYSYIWETARNEEIKTENKLGFALIIQCYFIIKGRTFVALIIWVVLDWSHALQLPLRKAKCNSGLSCETSQDSEQFSQWTSVFINQQDEIQHYSKAILKKLVQRGCEGAIRNGSHVYSMAGSSVTFPLAR